MSYAQIEDGVVTNVVEASPQYASSKGWIKLTEGFGIGDLYDGEFKHPPRWPDLDAAKEELHRLVAERHQAEERRGVRYVFPDGEMDVVQTRDLTDIRNLQSQLSAATALKAKGVTEPVMMFRGESNSNHVMTPDQMIDMGVAVVMMGQQTYEAKWLKDDEIARMNTLEEAESFDLDVGWPQ